jgi:cell division transport system permease protein
MASNPLRASGNAISSFSTIVGITLVLTMLSVLFIFLLVTQAVKSRFREEFIIQVMLKQDAGEQDVLDLKRRIEGEDYSGAVAYTSPEDAAKIMQEELGEEFVDFLGYNPLPASLDIHVNPDFGATDSMGTFASELEKNPLVKEVVFQKGLLEQMNENIGKWGLGLLIIGVLLLVIAVALIVVTIQLAVYSQRFLIKSMDLVGATAWFIQKPFLKQGLWYGLISSILSTTLISLLLFYFRVELKEVVEILMQQNRFLIMCGGTLVTGMLVSWLATAYAVRKFIRLKQDDLY